MYCRQCVRYSITEKLSCKCCGMRLRASPSNRVFKEKVRAKKNEVSAGLYNKKKDVQHPMFSLSDF